MIALRQPFGLVSLRYLVPGLSPQQRIHRQLLAAGPPGVGRAGGAIVNFWHWARWVAFGAWRASHRAVAAGAAAVEAELGISARRQAATVLWFALVHGVGPNDVYQLGLFRADRRAQWWSFVFTNEVAAFHRWRNGEHDVSAATALLADKVAFASTMAATGLPVVPTLGQVPAGASVQTLQQSLDGLGNELLFCKPRRGSGARGAFRVQTGSDGLRVWNLPGRRVDAADVDRFLERQLGHGENIIQPYVGTHRSLADLGGAAVEAITLRMITELDGDVRVYSAALEVPTRADDDAGYTWITVDPTTGMTRGDSCSSPFRTVAGRAVSRAVVAAGADREVPGWADIVEYAARAHRHVPELFAVAWDFIIGEDGPLLLEGNSGWGTIPPQLMHGPLLAERTNR